MSESKEKHSTEQEEEEEPQKQEVEHRIDVFEQRWNNEIKKTAIEPLERMLQSGIKPGRSKLFDAGEYVRIYSEHKNTFDCYLQDIVYPILNEKSGGAGTSGRKQQQQRQQQQEEEKQPDQEEQKEDQEEQKQKAVEFTVTQGIKTSFLLELDRQWKNFKIMNRWLQKFMSVLDKKCANGRSFVPLLHRGLLSFREHIFVPFEPTITQCILNLFYEDREGRTIVHPSMVANIIDIYVQMGLDSLEVYQPELEFPFLETTRIYYQTKRDEWIAQDSTPEYLRKVEFVIDLEEERVQQYFHPTTKPKLMLVLEEELLHHCQIQLLENESSGCYALLQNDKQEDLQRMYRLYQRLHANFASLHPIADIFKIYVQTLGNDIIQRRLQSIHNNNDSNTKTNTKEKNNQLNDDPVFIMAFIRRNEELLQVVKDYFNQHGLFQTTLENVFLDLINAPYVYYSHNAQNDNKTKTEHENNNAELLSTFCDRILKTHDTGSAPGATVDGGKLNEDDMYAYVKKTTRLFKYLTEKDRFLDLYRIQLAKRLLGQRTSFDDPFEKEMIASLKMECGQQFTSKLEGMINDLLTCNEKKDTIAEYVDTILQKDGTGNTLRFSVQVLSNGFWPTQVCYSPNITPTSSSAQMEQCMTAFYEWHNQQTNDRKLTWIFTQGSASIQGYYRSKSYDFQLSTLQAMILLEFNGGVTLSLETLKQRFNMMEEQDDSILKPLMHSLCFGKHKVLKKLSSSSTSSSSSNGSANNNKKKMNNKISAGDTFTANPNFTSKIRKIRVAVPSMKLSTSSSRIEEDRSTAIDAAVVRIMKARKTLSHRELIMETLKQLYFFKPNNTTIKKRIENLIDREYLERNPHDREKYNYLA